MSNSVNKRVVVGAVVLSSMLSLSIGNSNAGVIGQDLRLTSGGRGITFGGSGLVLTNIFSPALADFALRTGLIS